MFENKIHCHTNEVHTSLGTLYNQVLDLMDYKKKLTLFAESAKKKSTTHRYRYIEWWSEWNEQVRLKGDTKWYVVGLAWMVYRMRYDNSTATVQHSNGMRYYILNHWHLKCCYFCCRHRYRHRHFCCCYLFIFIKYVILYEEQHNVSTK